MGDIRWPLLRFELLLSLVEPNFVAAKLAVVNVRGCVGLLRNIGGVGEMLLYDDGGDEPELNGELLQRSQPAHGDTADEGRTLVNLLLM